MCCDLAKISNKEFRIRIEKVQSLLREKSIEGLFCTLGTNFQYLLNAKTKPSERLVLAIISSEGSPKIICPAFEFQIYSETTPLTQDDIHIWEETEDPYMLIEEISKDLGIQEARIAISPMTFYSVFSKIQSILPQASVEDGLSILETARMVKTDEEIDLLKKASEFSALGIESAIDLLEKGMTEKEISALVAKEMSSLSGEPSVFALVQIGENSSNPHGSPSDRKLKKNDVVLIDAGTTFQGYVGDITNTTVFGKPSQKFLEVYSIVEEANQRGVEHGKVGNLPSKVDAATRDFITEKGYGAYFTHRTGHGIGLDVHEAPYIIQTNKVPLLINNAFTIEPGIYLPGKFGVRIEDDVVSKETGGLRLSSPTRRYWNK